MLIRILPFFIFTSFVSLNQSKANLKSLQSLRQQRQQQGPTRFSFNLFRGSLINCTSLEEGDDYLVLYFPESGNYNFFERMYSWRKDCTLEQDYFEELKEDEPCLLERLEQANLESFEILNNLVDEVSLEHSRYRHYFQTKTKFLISDQRPNFIESAIAGLKSSINSTPPNQVCPFRVSIHAEVSFRVHSRAERFERRVEFQ